ncbi:hypothetical protein [Brevibacillus fulvus]|uniref:Exonuclease VII small subunit n=1 Tax=Brevibacillus fulvus TaxID=1125967 RepID=A0A938Y1K1_9BACL|nr:hypothetical protein [Brevibacillus fulvus]MBM7592239.1 exonuclease VII small subunit [Brevibacillus fulvus]
MDEIKDLQKGITDILVAIGKIETEIKQLNNMAGKLDATEKLAIEAMQSTRSAHKRIDGLNKEVETLVHKAEESKREGKDDKKWLIGVVLSVLALIWNVMKR